jgi:hypothetical protein
MLSWLPRSPSRGLQYAARFAPRDTSGFGKFAA